MWSEEEREERRENSDGKLSDLLINITGIPGTEEGIE